MAKLDEDKLRSLLDFDANGVFTWRIRPVEAFSSSRACNSWNAKYAGTVAGNINNRGYRLIKIDGGLHLASRLAWLMTNGEMPSGQIDHINGNRDDNRPDNLRDVSQAENMRNKKRYSTNKSGVPGVYFSVRQQVWRAVVRVDGSNRSLGNFKDKNSAIAARERGARAFGFHVNHGRAA